MAVDRLGALPMSCYVARTLEAPFADAVARTHAAPAARVTEKLRDAVHNL